MVSRSRLARGVAGPTVGLLALAACAGGSGSPPTPTPSVDPCLVAVPAGPRPDTLVIALPYDPSQRDLASTPLVARHRLEPLLSRDCAGQWRAGLAERWIRVADPEPGWEIVLKPGLLAADGSPLDAAALVAAWAGQPWWRDGVTATSARSLRIPTPAAQAEPPDALGDPRLASRVRPSLPVLGERHREVDLGAGTGTGAVLRFVELPERADPRDALDGRGSTPRADLLLTDDPAVLDYARQQSGFTVTALPWETTYVLLVPRAAPVTVPSGDREALAREAVRIDARAALQPHWWTADARCREPAGRGRRDNHVAFSRSDPVARALAERLVAMAATPDPPPWLGTLLPASSGGPRRVLALGPGDLDDALRQGRHAAFVLAYPRAAPLDCRDLEPRPAQAAEVALIDARRHLVIRAGSPPVLLLANGMFRVMAELRP